ncbi:MAG: hypothetical protein F4206_06200 [Gammaproteobacteria bacterium]|nr:hypothetical protein [Gammaproteobacteria bacterium]MYG66305.1 hypothetical protein [Gammaproteobacteria bacterium]
MYNNYCVNSNAQYISEDHEVHNLDNHKNCLPNPVNRVPLGAYLDCHGAVARAKQLGYSTANGCAHCCPACHTT